MNGEIPMDKLYKDSETGCCPRFNPKPWEDKEITWKDELFLRDRVRCIFHIPIGMDKMMLRNMEMITKADALPEEPLMLSDEGSMWGSNVFIKVSKEVPGAKMERISGKFLSRVYEGPYQDAGKWAKEMKEYVEGKGKKIKKMYFCYTTCPACAKYYGKNYVILLAQV